jgi:general secretion pathway protein E
LGVNVANVYQAKGCAACSQSGFAGRTGIYEMVTVDEKMRELIHDGASEQELARYARSLAPSISQDGKRKIMAGITSVDEVLRVSLDD